MDKKKKIAITVSLAAVVVIASVWGYFFLTKKDMPEESKPFGFEVLKFNDSYVSTDIMIEERNKFFDKYKRDARVLRMSEEERTDMLLDETIERLVLEDFMFEKSGISVTDTEAEEYINSFIKKRYSDPGELGVFMSSQGYMNEEGMKKGIKEYLLKHKCFFNTAKEKGVTVSDEELSKEYEKHKMQNKKVNLKHIFISNKDRTKEEAKALAQEIYTKLQNKEDFEALAKEHSDDEDTKNIGGVKNDVTAGFHEPSFDNAVFNSEPGQLLEPIEVLRGYEIVYVDKVVDFYRTKEQYAEILTVDKFLESDSYKEWIKELEKDNKIEITDPGMRAFRFVRKQQYNEAAKSYEEAYELENNPVYIERASEAYRLAGNWEELIRVSKTGIKKYSSNVALYLNQAEGEFKTDNKDQALKLLKKAEGFSKDNTYQLSRVKKMYEDLGFNEDAKRIGEKLGQ